MILPALQQLCIYGAGGGCTTGTLPVFSLRVKRAAIQPRPLGSILVGIFTTYHCRSGLMPITAITVPLATRPMSPKGPPGPLRTLSGSMVTRAGAPEAGAAGVILRGRSGVRSIGGLPILTTRCTPWRPRLCHHWRGGGYADRPPLAILALADHLGARAVGRNPKHGEFHGRPAAQRGWLAHHHLRHIGGRRREVHRSRQQRRGDHRQRLPGRVGQVDKISRDPGYARANPVGGNADCIPGTVRIDAQDLPGVALHGCAKDREQGTRAGAHVDVDARFPGRNIGWRRGEIFCWEGLRQVGREQLILQRPDAELVVAHGKGVFGGGAHEVAEPARLQER